MKYATDTQRSLSVIKRVCDLLDRRARDVYPINIRVGLAECAVRHAPVFDGAIRWLRDSGHLK